ncbi:hypothetical protein JGS39_35605 [Streptomyces sp. P01-B04]|uniref:hypothetical protein n=1 Tax=Streptomyces poriferorum TaxID=2798799 RepID=UPI001C5E9FD9|nr:hypothetical protein [Streptomyces poriferorum]MBW5254232.1 hypothetical protein [Streptomyces poriferorum]MBW5262087.1 hypothetical protein [Streptomyces poriferorum]
MTARALVARSRPAFFGGATSALDNPTRGPVAESSHRPNAIRLVIAHRLSTVIDADCIVVMEGGWIVRQGTYEQRLAETDGPFARPPTDCPGVGEANRMESVGLHASEPFSHVR